MRVIEGAAYVVFYGIIAAVSPLVMSATFIVIPIEHFMPGHTAVQG